MRRSLIPALTLVIGLAAAGCGSTQGDGGGGTAAQRGTDATGGAPAVAWGGPENPSGVVLDIPGGGWQEPSRAAYAHEVQVARAIQAGGYATAVIRYDPGARGFQEIRRVYQAARRRYPDQPICAIGGSAGGHLALMLAIREHDLRCVVDMAGPTDLTSLGAQGSEEGQSLADTAFGRKGLSKYSPVEHANAIQAPVLGVYAENDPLVPIQQGQELAQALPGSELIKLPAGSTPWIHSAVAGAALQAAMQREIGFLRRSLSGSG